VRPTYARSAWLFRRLLGVVYVCAFWSITTQVLGLVGSHGILPASEFMDAAKAESLGLTRLHLVPTLFWISTSDAFLRAVSITGMAAGALTAVGIAPLAMLATAWVAYLSLAVVAQEFFYYQWDGLLLETGFLAPLISPARWRDRASDAPDPVRPALWLMLWLVFRLMIASGAVKLTSGDPTWASLTAMTFHFETQPLPTPLAWYAHHLPQATLKGMAAAVIAVELFAPLLRFFRRFRPAAFVLLAGLQAVIALTGNYGWFNVLSGSLCLFLLDDARLGFRAADARRRRLAPVLVAAGAAITLPASVPAFAWSLGLRPAEAPLASIAESVARFRIANRYGLFAVMTTTRPEIIVEGSDDGEIWQPYEFKYKPGDVRRPPPWVAPHQPRLDWQMWFAALAEDDTEPWFQRFIDRLLDASPEVLRLLAHDPFEGRPPRFVRARLLRYRFSDEGPAWWTSEVLGEFSPPRSAVAGR
jgi:hypothetical protein